MRHRVQDGTFDAEQRFGGQGEEHEQEQGEPIDIPEAGVTNAAPFVYRGQGDHRGDRRRLAGAREREASRNVNRSESCLALSRQSC